MLSATTKKLRRGINLTGGALAITAVFALLLMFLGVIPLRSYQAQKHDLAANSERLAMLSSLNAKLEARVTLLKTDTEVARLAREQFNMIKPGQNLLITPGVRGDQIGVANSPYEDDFAPAPSAKQSKAPSPGRAILDTLMFWR